MFDSSSKAKLNLAKPSRFNDILQKYLFRIPEFQRGYSWEVKELRDFIQDLETIIKNHPNTGEHHNFGTIQCKQQGEYEAVDINDHDATLYDVSDGQQRLITTLLFLRALGETMKELNEPKHLDGLQSNFSQSYMEKTNSVGGRGPIESIQRLTIPIHQPFNDCLRDLILSGTHRPDSPTPVRLMKQALEWFREELDGKNLSDCYDYKKAILERAEVVILSNLNSNQHMVFEARNNRGRPVSELDKVKNLIQLIEQRGHISGNIDFPRIWFDSLLRLDEYNLTGRTIENLVVSYAIGISVRRRHVQPNTCYDDFREKFWELTERSNRTKEAQLADFVQGYQDVVEAFRQLRKENTAIDLPRFNTNPRELKRARDAIYNIRLSNKVGVMEPILIACYLSIDKEKLADFAEVAQTAERALFRIHIAPRSGQPVNRVDWRKNERYEAAFDIYHKVPMDRNSQNWCLPKESRNNAVRSLPELLVHEYAIHFLCDLTINQARRNLTSMMQDIAEAKNAYNTGSNWGHYLLFQYEKEVNPALHAFWHDTFVVSGRDSRSFTMEHIMPQDPREELGGSIPNYWLRNKSRGFASPEESEAYLNRLGNLVVSKADRNSWYSNHPYRCHSSEAGSPNKSSMYRDRSSHGGDWNRVYEIGRYYANWGKHTIVHRHQFISLWTVGRWKMNCSCDVEPNDVDMRILEPIVGLTKVFSEDHGDKDWYLLESAEDSDSKEAENEVEEDLADDDETLLVTEEQESSDIESSGESESPNIEAKMETSYATERRVWIEKTNLDGESHRIEGERALGSAIWSPQRARSNIPGRKGADIYRFMREVSQGDIIIHLADKRDKARITGVSKVKSPEVLLVKGLANTRWDEKTDCYMHLLEGYAELTEPLRIYEYLLTNHNKNELDQIRADQEASFFNEKNNLREGAYLTPCSTALGELINRVCIEINNENLPYFSRKQVAPGLDEESVKAAETIYGSDANFGSNWSDDEIVFGSERPGYGYNSEVPQASVRNWVVLMRSRGIKRVVCLLHPEGKLQLYDHLREGLEGHYKTHFGEENVLMAPIVDHDISTKDNIRKIVEFLEESERLSLPVVVHCSAGIGRTGHVLAVWRSLHWRVDRDKALKSTNWGSATRHPLEALGKESQHLGRLIDRTDFYDLMDAVRMEEEE